MWLYSCIPMCFILLNPALHDLFFFIDHCFVREVGLLTVKSFEMSFTLTETVERYVLIGADLKNSGPKTLLGLNGMRL